MEKHPEKPKLTPRDYILEICERIAVACKVDLRTVMEGYRNLWSQVFKFPPQFSNVYCPIRAGRREFDRSH